MLLKTVFLGLKEEWGSWKIICIFLLISFISESENLQMSLPSHNTSPSVGSTRRRIALATVVFPDPDSPTKPKESPPLMKKDIPSTALTFPLWPPMNLFLRGKYFFKFFNSNNGKAIFFFPGLEVKGWGLAKPQSLIPKP